MQYPILSLPFHLEAATRAARRTKVSSKVSEDWLRDLAQAVSDGCLGLLKAAGVTADRVPGGKIGLGIIAFAALAPIVSLMGWLLLRLLRAQLFRYDPERGAASMIVSALRPPLKLLLWAFGLFISLSPLLMVLSKRRGGNAAFELAHFLVLVSGCVAIIWFLALVLDRMERRAQAWTKHSRGKFDDVLVPLIFRSLRYIVPMLGVVLFFELTAMPPVLVAPARLITSILVIGSISWLLAQVILALDDLILARYQNELTQTVQARGAYTQVRVIQRIALVILGVLTLAAVLLLFPQARRVGTTILASAGVVSLIVGFGLQKALGNLFAGIQIAFTQPIRIGDVVIVENEWGRIEEITLTYVVVKIWDLRRMVLPISYFIDKPFQNWTRSSTAILGTIFLYVDYRIPVDELREAFKSMVEEHPLWNRETYSLQVTNCTDRTMELRVLVSADDSGKVWDLRCDLRERMIAHIQQSYPDSLPRIRLERDPEHSREQPLQPQGPV